MKTVTIGGTGLIGSRTVPILRRGDHEVFASSPKSSQRPAVAYANRHEIKTLTAVRSERWHAHF